MHRLSAFLLAVPFIAVCSPNSETGAGECSGNSDCGPGEVCVGGACKPVCGADTDCDAGYICDGDLCAPGTRDTPRIDTIDGDGNEVCPDAQGSHCVKWGLFVRGSNLEGAAFELITPANRRRRLIARSGATDTQVEFDLPSDVEIGMHTLRATNAAGSVDQAFQFIQGPQGQPGSDGSPDSAQQVLDKLMTVDGSGSGLDADSIDGTHYADIQTSLDALSAQLNAVVPPGTIVPFAGETVPEGWLLCDGAEVDRVEYANLFGTIGVTHGAGDLIDTFNIPDLRGRFVRGVDAGVGRDPDAGSRTADRTGGNAGDAVGTVQGDGVRSHSHRNTWERIHACSGGSAGTNSSFWSGDCSLALVTYTGAYGGNETRPTNVSVNFIIKY